MTLDESLKYKTYYNQILNDLISKGRYPTHQEIESLIGKMNLAESYFKVAPVVEGHTFETATYNAQAAAIEEDLRTLYFLVNHFIEEEYTRLTQYAETTLSALEMQAAYCLTKSQLDAQTMHLGKCVYFNNGSFMASQENEYVVIDCGKILLVDGAQITLLLDGDNSGSALLELKNEDTTLTLTSDEQRFLPGSQSKNEIIVTIPSTPLHHERIMLPYVPKTICDYVVLSGENSVVLTTATETKLSDARRIDCYEETMIDFYVKDAKSVHVTVSAAPLQSNFDTSGESRVLTQAISHFYIKMPANSTIDILSEGGKIYAHSTKGIVENNTLSIVHHIGLKEFLIVEKDYSKVTHYDATLKIRGTIDTLRLNTIMLKEAVV